MQTFSAATLTALEQSTTTITKCVKFTRLDGTIHALTSFNRDLIVDGQTYTALGGATATALESSSGLSVDNIEVQTLIESTGLTESDIIAGLMDFATYITFDVDYEAVLLAAFNIRAGTVGEYSHSNPEAIFQLRSLAQSLQQTIGELGMKKCAADLGDAKCKIVLASHTVTGTVSAVTDRRTFTVTVAPAAHGGLFTFTGGNNNGLSMEVRVIAGLVINLTLPLPFDVTIGDAYSVYRGCDKLFSTCKATFANTNNFRGNPFFPGNDDLRRYADST
jgi:uncharacterized phage protein (TIGR02218 family)